MASFPGMVRRFYGRVREFFSDSPNPWARSVWRSMSWVSGLARSLFRPSNDWGRPDYDFWRRAYYCRVKGLELSGLFIKPIVNKIAAWVLGRQPQVRTDNDGLDEAIAGWMEHNHPHLLRAYRMALRQGDEFIAVNPDLTLTLVPPELVDPIVAEDDYSKVVGWRVTQNLRHPERTADRMTIIDEYRAEYRSRSVRIGSGEPVVEVFPNPLGEPTLVHVPNSLEDGAVFGRAEADPLLDLLHRYGQVLEAAVEGNVLQGRPTPVISFGTVSDLNAFWARYGEEEVQHLPDGTSRTYTTLSVDLNQIITLSNATFSYEAPGSFTQDTERLLGLMFYLFLEHAELPEFIMGNAISSSKASAEAQMPQFEEFIRMRRGETMPWLLRVVRIASWYMAFLNPGLGVPSPEETPSVQWQRLTQDGRLTLDALKWAYLEGLIDRRTALSLAPLDVEDVDAVLDAAEQERQARLDEQQERMLAPGGENDLDDEIRALVDRGEEQDEE